jgi:membrane-bound lytic murein transglycosylase MltF
MIWEFLRKQSRVLTVITMALAMNACHGPHWFWLSLSSRAQAPGATTKPLVVATVYGQLTAKKQYRFRTGFKQDVLEKFAQDQGRSIKLLFFKTNEAARNALKEGHADILALPESQSFDFVFRRKDVHLQSQYNRWFVQASRAGAINEIRARYFSYANELNELDRHYLNAHIRSRLPNFKNQFRTSARDFQIPWTWLAAVAYQESKWDDEAVSFTGVRGLMQVTWETADALGIEDRHDSMQSIFAGAKYLNQLIKRMPKKLADREKFILSLICYNVGVAHLLDAQKLAQEKNLNPWSWSSMQQVLPLLAQEKYYSRLKYGYARGEEPVKFVRRVLSYLEVLEKP